MSKAHVAIVRAIFETNPAIDRETILAQLDQVIPAVFTEDVEFVETPERIDARTLTGHAGVKQAFVRFLDQWERYSAELVGVEDHGDSVLAIVEEHATGAGSGAPVENTLYVICDFRRAKICRYREFYEAAAARGALRGRAVD